jgi:hypothetical protein
MKDKLLYLIRQVRRTGAPFSARGEGPGMRCTGACLHAPESNRASKNENAAAALIRATAFALLLSPLFATAQKDVRTVKTTVADILVLLPAKDYGQADRIYGQLIKLNPDGLAMVTNQVVPNGNPDGVASRFAVSLLTHGSKTKLDKAKIEQAYLAALKKATETEVKAYFISNLQLIGSAASVPALSQYINNKELADPAIEALVSIGTLDAKKVLFIATAAGDTSIKPKLVKALGALKYTPALPVISKLSAENDFELRKQSLWAMALMGSGASYQTLLQQARNVSFKAEPSEATKALVEYLHQVSAKGDTALASKISSDILANTSDASQQYARLAALEVLAQKPTQPTVVMLAQELEKFDAEYRKEVLNIAIPSAKNPAVLGMWKAVYEPATGVQKAEILTMLSQANQNSGFADSYLLPALSSENKDLRMAAATQLAATKNKTYAAALVDYLAKTTDDAELAAAKAALLQLTDKSNASLAAAKIDAAAPKAKIALLEVLAERRATQHFDVAAQLFTSNDEAVKAAAYAALPNLSAPNNMSSLLTMLAATDNEAATKSIQSAIVAALDKSSIPLVNAAYEQQKAKLLPVLPYASDKSALDKVMTSFSKGTDAEKELAFAALEKWQNQDAVRTLRGIRQNPSFAAWHGRAFAAYISQVSKSNWPDDQKLLMLEEIMPLASTVAEKNAVLRAIGGTRTFLALMYVSQFLEDKDLSAAASRSAMQIALPTGDGAPGLEGAEVRKVLVGILAKLTGADSQYEKIDIQTYLAKMPYTKGYEPIFNGKDLTGWQGLVENPIARSKMSKEELAQKQAAANEKLKLNWSVRDGAIWFTGNGDNLCTIKHYADFDMVADCKISKEGDSGFYLRGSPQVQIWDTSRVDVGAQVGSGGLYNNQKYPSKPLVLADNAIGEWNTFRIKMIGEKVTVYLNGVLVVDNVPLENYWDRKLPIFPSEAIELQAHGTELAFRNLYIKELGTKPYELTKDEQQQGFELLYNGSDMDKWDGNKTDYVVEDNAIAIYPNQESHGNLYTKKEYSDFVFRFQFQLTPGANNGIGIHAPIDGDAAYVGKEIQVLDNDAPVYANLEKYQYHGSVYGVIPAKRGFLKPTGEWNEEEIYVKGDYIKVTLNGTVILEGDMKKASENGTLDHKDHPGLLRHKGHIAFLGHGSVVKFKDLRVKEL